MTKIYSLGNGKFHCRCVFNYSVGKLNCTTGWMWSESSLASQTPYPLNHMQFMRKGVVQQCTCGFVCIKAVVFTDDICRIIICVGVLSPLIHVEKDYSTLNKIIRFHIIYMHFKNVMTSHLQCTLCAVASRYSIHTKKIKYRVRSDPFPPR